MVYFVYSKSTGEFITTAVSKEVLNKFLPTEVDVVVY